MIPPEGRTQSPARVGDLPGWLRARLAEGLPGAVAQRPFSPELSYGRHFGPVPAKARAASVLLLLYTGPAGWSLPLIRRTSDMQFHAGQIGLPGGLREGHETSQQTALRETFEELQVSPERVKMLGALSPVYLFVSNSLIAPWVAWTAERPAFVPNPAEVETVLEAPLAQLGDLGSQQVARRQQRGVWFEARHFEVHGHEVWGATAMILAEFLAVVSEWDHVG